MAVTVRGFIEDWVADLDEETIEDEVAYHASVEDVKEPGTVDVERFKALLTDAAASKVEAIEDLLWEAMDAAGGIYLETAREPTASAVG